MTKNGVGSEGKLLEYRLEIAIEAYMDLANEKKPIEGFVQPKSPKHDQIPVKHVGAHTTHTDGRHRAILNRVTVFLSFSRWLGWLQKVDPRLDRRHSMELIASSTTEQMADIDSLYSRIGGQDVVDDLVERFYRKIMRDDRINSLFGRVDVDRVGTWSACLRWMCGLVWFTYLDASLLQIKKHQARFLSMILGGPDQHEFANTDLTAIHARHNINVSNNSGTQHTAQGGHTAASKVSHD